MIFTPFFVTLDLILKQIISITYILIVTYVDALIKFIDFFIIIFNYSQKLNKQGIT